MIGDEQPDLMLMCWGSTLGAVLEAASELRNRGRSVATLHFAQVWPLRVQPLRDILEQANEVVCIESNATGQLARLIRRETGFEIHRSVLRYDGLPITPGFILGELKQ